MTNKVIEKMAKAINEVWNNQHNVYANLTSAREFAQAALSTLPIIILPDDAEPMEGDLYLLDDDSYRKETLLLDKELIKFWKERPKGKIIRRDNKAVIMESEVLWQIK